jgi:hypothetical protein
MDHALIEFRKAAARHFTPDSKLAIARVIPARALHERSCERSHSKEPISLESMWTARYRLGYARGAPGDLRS